MLPTTASHNSIEDSDIIMTSQPKYVRNALDAIATGIGGCKHYGDSLLRALDDTKPIFTLPAYESFFWQCATTVPGWVQSVLIESAVSESFGSQRLRTIVQAIDYNKDAEDGMTVHAKDEAYHSRLFLKLVRDAFPFYISDADFQNLQASFTPVDAAIPKSGLHLPEDVLIDYLVQINLSEVRTLMNLHLLAPILWGCAPPEKRERVITMLQSLQRDEIRHITYTAHLMEGWAAGGDADLVKSLFSRNMSEFNTYSADGTKAAVQQYGQGQFPALLLD